MSLSVSGVGYSPALALFVANQMNAAQDRVANATAHLAANTRVLTAADDPGDTGRIQSLISQIGENSILLGLNSQARTAIAGYSSDLAGVQTALDTNDPAQVAAAINALTGTTGGVPTWSGDPSSPPISTVHHTATTGTLTGAAIGTVTVPAASGNGKGAATLNLTLDGNAVALSIASGSYTAGTAAAAIQQALTAAGYTATATSDGTKVTLTSGTTGTASSVTATGTAAAVLGLTTGTATAGADAYDQQVTGPDGPRQLTFAGRPVTLPNLQQYAAAITTALAAGDTTAAAAAMTSVQSVVSDTQSTLGATDQLFQTDSAARGNAATTLAAQLDNLTALDVPTTEAQLAKDQLLVEQNAWLLQQMAQNSETTMKVLFGITS